MGSHDDQILATLVGKADDRLARGTDYRHEVERKLAPGKARSRFFELGLGPAGCLGVILDLDGCGHIRNDELRAD